MKKLGDGSYRLQEMLTTDDMGIALSPSWTRKRNMWPWSMTFPTWPSMPIWSRQTEKRILPRIFPQAPPETLTAQNLEAYYYVAKPANESHPVLMQSGTLTNVEHWAQLQIEKFIYVDDPDAQGRYDGHAAGS